MNTMTHESIQKYRSHPAQRAVAVDSEEKRYPLRRGLVGYLGFYVGLAIARLTTNLQAVGTENIPKETPYVIAANHQTYVDGLLVSAFLPRKHFKILASLTAKDLEDQHGWFGRLIVRVGRGIASTASATRSAV
jgi:1-acyl-sn-glycerol-3-phosphate acyltransferase